MATPPPPAEAPHPPHSIHRYGDSRGFNWQVFRRLTVRVVICMAFYFSPRVVQMDMLNSARVRDAAVSGAIAAFASWLSTQGRRRLEVLRRDRAADAPTKEVK